MKIHALLCCLVLLLEIGRRETQRGPVGDGEKHTVFKNLRGEK